MSLAEQLVALAEQLAPEHYNRSAYGLLEDAKQILWNRPDCKARLNLEALLASRKDAEKP